MLTCGGQLGDDEEVLSLELARANPLLEHLADDVLVHVGGRGVDVAVAGLQGRVEGALQLALLGLRKVPT